MYESVELSFDLLKNCLKTNGIGFRRLPRSVVVQVHFWAGYFLLAFVTSRRLASEAGLVSLRRGRRCRRRRSFLGPAKSRENRGLLTQRDRDSPLRIQDVDIEILGEKVFS
jgi:hypothetical protein